MTQTESDMFQFRNVSPTACTLKGYPVINLLGTAGTKLAFHYRYGANQMLTDNPPHPVPLAAGAVAFAGVSKTSCTALASAEASRAMVASPGRSGTASVTLPLPLDFCGADDPGHVIYISPFEPTIQEVLRQP
jgi:hypothetical protein